MSEFEDVHMVIGVPEQLRTWWGNFLEDDKEMAQLIEEKMGNLLALLHVASDRNLVRALLSFWSPSRVVFRFKDFEITPTLEEIAGLTGLKCQGKEMIIPRSQSGRKFLNKLGLAHNRDLGCFQENWVSLDYLYGRFGYSNSFRDFKNEFECSRDTWRKRRPLAFVIALLGVLVFPSQHGRIRTCLGFIARVLLYGLDGKEFTIVPTMLAEIFRALNQCKRGHPYFQGCNLLLQLWAVERLYRREVLRDVIYCGTNPIASQNKRLRRRKREIGPTSWLDFLAGLTAEDVMWKLTWVRDEKIALRSQKRYYIELIGLTGLQPYAPLRVLRQFGHCQVIPLCSDMSVSEVEFGTEFKIPRAAEILKEWNNLTLEKKGTHEGSCTPEYEAWIKEDLGKAKPSITGQEGFEDTTSTTWIRYARLGTLTITPEMWTQMYGIYQFFTQQVTGSSLDGASTSSSSQI